MSNTSKNKEEKRGNIKEPSRTYSLPPTNVVKRPEPRKPTDNKKGGNNN